MSMMGLAVEVVKIVKVVCRVRLHVRGWRHDSCSCRCYRCRCGGNACSTWSRRSSSAVQRERVWGRHIVVGNVRRISTLMHHVMMLMMVMLVRLVIIRMALIVCFVRCTMRCPIFCVHVMRCVLWSEGALRMLHPVCIIHSRITMHLLVLPSAAHMLMSRMMHVFGCISRVHPTWISGVIRGRRSWEVWIMISRVRLSLIVRVMIIEVAMLV